MPLKYCNIVINRWYTIDYMDFNEANIKRLEGILKTLDLGVSKEELKSILERMAAVVLKIEKRNAEVITDLQTQHAKLLKDAKEDLSTSEKELKKKVDYLFVRERLDALSAEHKDRMDAVKSVLTRLERRIEEIKDGEDGDPGEKGEPGSNGSPDTPEEIALKLNTLDSAVNIEVIKGLKDELSKRIVQQGQRVGWGAHPLTIQDDGTIVLKVARNLNFGTGLSVSVNASGVATISATGSGYQAPTSGTINGTNTIFVFTTAPVAIVVDGGRTMQKTSGDGTVNWTGTTTVTLSIAPVFDIFSVA